MLFIFSQEQEAKLVQHIKGMADLGYGYTIAEVVNKASDYALYLKKRTSDKPLSIKWFKGFKRRWPELSVIKPRSLTTCRASSTTKDVVEQYFSNLEVVLSSNNLLNRPELIYNIDEKGIQTEHSPPYVVSGKASVPAITSARSAITTIIGGGNALGTQLPPYFVFKGQRFNPDLLKGSTPGSAATMSKTGWSNSSIFYDYLQHHFIKYVQRSDASQPILLIFDGHKSHINIPVLEWAKNHNIILFVLPAHTSHVLQPLDVGCYGPLQKIYNNSCHKFLRENPSSKITRYNVASLASSSYVTALSHSNLCSSFKRTGIFPLDKSAVSEDNFKPSEPFVSAPCATAVNDVDQQPDLDAFFTAAETVIENKKQFHQSAKANLSKLASGKEITNNQSIADELENRSKSMESSKKRKKTAKNSTKKKQATTFHVDFPHPKPQPGPSGITVSASDTDSSSDDDIPETEKCCVCKLYQPKQLKNCVSLVFTKWAQCDDNNCKHWTHLKYCCKQSVLRRHDKFLCPCHDLKNTEE